MKTFDNRLLIALLLASLLSTNFATAWAASAGKPGLTANFTTLRAALKEGALTMKVKGDGETTTKVQLGLTNKTDHVLKVVIPANEILLSRTLSIQHMMVTKDRIVTVPAGGAIWAEIPTMCVSVKTVKPPPAVETEFTVGAYPDETVWKQLASIVEAARILNRSGAYDGTMFAKERREQTIAQLAVWLLLGKRSDKPEDSVTAEGIAAETLDKMGIKRDQLTKEKQQMFDKGVDEIFLAIDLTVKKSKEPEVEQKASLPKDSKLDTFAKVGARALDVGDFTEAEELLTAAVEEGSASSDKDPNVATSLNDLALCYLSQGKPAEAADYFKRASELRAKILGPEFAERAESLNGLGLALKAQGKHAESSVALEQAIAIREKSLGANHSLVAESANNLALSYAEQERFADAETLLRRALLIRYKNLGAASAEVAETNKNLADLYFKQAKFAQSEKSYKRALEISQRTLGAEHPFTSAIIDSYAECCRSLGREADADELAKQSDALKQKLFGSNISLVSSVPQNHRFLERLALFSSQTGGLEAGGKTLVITEKLAATTTARAAINRPVKDKWALVIGISKFQDPSINLKYAAKDAEDFYHYLINEAHFAPDHVHLLTNENATRENILAEVGDKWLPRVADPDDLVLIYLSSHGSPSKADVRGTNYLVAHNTSKDSLYATGIAMPELSKMVKDRVHSDRVVLLLDACHSGAAQPTTKGLFRQANFDAETVVQGSGQLVICSSEPNQLSWESNAYPNGVFTHYLIEGLRKQGDKTSLGIAFQFMKDKVQQEVLHDRGELQTPVLKSRWEGKDLLLASPPAEPRPGLETGTHP